jgi:hypothetical protein
VKPRGGNVPGLEVIGIKDSGLDAEGQAQGLEGKAIDLEVIAGSFRNLRP